MAPAMIIAMNPSVTWCVAAICVGERRSANGLPPIIASNSPASTKKTGATTKKRNGNSMGGDWSGLSEAIFMWRGQSEFQNRHPQAWWSARYGRCRAMLHRADRARGEYALARFLRRGAFVARERYFQMAPAAAGRVRRAPALLSNGLYLSEQRFPLCRQNLIHDRVENIFFLVVMLLHHHQQGFRKAAVLLRIFAFHCRAHLFEELLDLRMFHEHDMHRTGRAAGRCQCGEKHLLFPAKVPCHVVAEGLEGGFGVAPVVGEGGRFGIGKFNVAGLMVVGHKFRNGFHVSFLVNEI